MVVTQTFFHLKLMLVSLHFQDTEFLSVRFKALSKDALNSSHPVSSIVKTPEQVEEMFDSVSYEKVCCKISVELRSISHGV